MPYNQPDPYKRGLPQSTVKTPTQPVYNLPQSTVQTPTQPIYNQLTPAVKTQTVSDIYGGINYNTPEQQAFIDQQAEQNRLTATTPVDEASLRQQTQQRFQAEIDALNRVYAEKKRQEQIAGQNRLGQVGAVQARRGLLGSDFGAAQETGQTQENTNVMSAIENERMMKENAILSEARIIADNEIEKKRIARETSADAYIKYINESGETKKANAQQMAKRLYDNGIENADLKAIAKTLGVSESVLKTTYNDYKKEADASKKIAEAQAKAEANKIALDTKKTEADIAKTVADTKTPASERMAQEERLLKEGFSYVQTPAQRDQLIKQGYDISIIGGRAYAKAPKLTTKTVKVGSTTYSVTTNEAGDIVKKTVVAGGGKGVPSSKTTKPNPINEMSQAMSEVVGSDGYISPQDYTDARGQWIGAGLNATEFDTKFKGYRNPNNPNYVTVKQ